MIDPARLPDRAPGRGKIGRAKAVEGEAARRIRSRARDRAGDRAFFRGGFPLYQDAAEEGDVVLFAGAGGVDQAVEEVLHEGLTPPSATPSLAMVNHWTLAVSVNKRNFPASEHWCADVFDTDPAYPLAGKRLRLLWLSPDCRHFSPAKGSAPVSDSIRALAWIALPWIIKRRPRVIMLENVPAFMTWGPTMLNEAGDRVPDPARKGETFLRWKRAIEKAGYTIEFRIMNSADDGEATGRVRLFAIMRCDGQPIEWGEDTHAAPAVAKARGLRPHRGAYEIIDFSRPCHSIFLTQEEARERGLKIKRPLQEATLARIAKGLFRYTIDSADPFIVPLTHQGSVRVHDIRNPMPVVTGAHRGELALCEPYIVPITQRTWHADRTIDLRKPLPVVTASKGGEFALCAPVVTVFRRDSDGKDVRDPLPAITANSFIKRPGGAAPLGISVAHLTRQFGASVGSDLGEPMGSVMAGGGGKTALTCAFMEQANTGLVGHDMRESLSTILGKGSNQRLVTAAISEFRGSNEGSGDIRQALTAITANGHHHALLESVLEREHDMAVPFAPEGEVRAFLAKYYGKPTEHDLRDPLGTATSKARFGLIMVHGVAYRIVDIGMRMLDPETELAAAMGVRKGFVLGFDAEGNKVSKTAITKMVGNMVCRRTARRLIRANLGGPLQSSNSERAAA